MSAIHSLKLHEKIDATRKYIHNRRHRLPMLASIEMTKHCNAGCDFCDDWKTKHSPKLGDVVDMVRQLNPMVLAITGGEPLLEKKLVQIVRDVKAHQRFIYVYVITNGSLLTEEKATQLFDAGLDQISISLNYLDARQDEERKLPGLYEHVAELVPKLTAAGHNMLANTVIMRENLDQILSMARRTLEWGAKVSFSCYTDFKNGNRAHYFSGDQIDELSHIVDALIQHKSTHGNITNSRYYLERIVPYFTNGGIPGCKAGTGFVQLTPDGQVRQCADFAPFVHYTQYRGMEPTECTRCWYSCRGEAEASLTLERVLELWRRT
ncbi:MAG: radical SAM protein [Candidatus Latescibacterota bacterium]|nr:MAG: radical SAM protein [Candidatus Latescibacterota bacterium]